MHTDEYLLTHSIVTQWLRNYVFSGMRQIKGAYLLVSYDPAIDACPHIRLNVSS